MKESMREQDVPGASVAESDSDYRVREIEARLERRIEALESQRGRLQWTARIMGAAFVATLIPLAIVLLAVFGHDRALTASSVSTQAVVLRDAAGVTRGHLDVGADGRVQFSLSDRDGQGRIRLTVLADGSPGVTLSDANARPRAVLGYLPDGTTNLVFADAQGTSRAVVGVEPDGASHALFSDRTGRIRTLVGVGADGIPAVSVLDSDRQGPYPGAP